MTIRKLEQKDWPDYFAMSKEFYQSDAVLHPIPDENYQKTFRLLLEGNPFVDGCIVEENGKAVGYALLALTWSNEGGGLAVWLEEIYVRPQFQDRGIGRTMIRHILKKYQGKAMRFRLETEKANSGAQHLYKSLGFQYFQYFPMILEPPFPSQE